jgi:hypothetical protein
MRPSLVALALVSITSTAVADSGDTQVRAKSAPATYDIGFRLGGYGFKREGDSRAGEGWTECRMNGLGIFGSRVMRGPVYLESGLDLYTSGDDDAVATDAMDLPIDRMSGILSIAGGARTNVTSWLRAFVQVGTGVELTRVAVPYGDGKAMRDTQVLPMGFIGFGVELRYGRTAVGMNLRTMMMGNYNYKPTELDEQAWGVGTPNEAEVLDASLDFAAQGQFYLRRDL